MKRSLLKMIATVTMLAVCLGAASCSKKKDAATEKLEITVGITQEPTVFDPHTVVAAGDKEILFNIFEGLYKFGPDGSLNPCLATDVDISDDAKTYTFTLREGVKFHNGNAMDADDVVYSLKRASGLLEGSDGTALVRGLEGISEITKTDDGKVKVVLSSPDSEKLSYFTVGIVPDEVEDPGTDIIGTGPFKFSSYEIGQSVVIEKNADYWGTQAYADTVTFKICSDMDSGFIELENGTIDIFPYLTTEKAGRLDPEKFDVLSKGSDMVQIFALNNDVEPFDDANVRRAVNLALNRDDIIALTMDGAGLPLTTGMSPVIGEAYDKSVDGAFDQDIEQAKKLLEEAGYKDGFDMTITVPSNYLIHVDTAVAIADQLSKIGINAQIEQVDWATWLEDTYQGRNFQSTVIALTSDFAPYDILSRYDSENDGNFINYRNDEYDRIIREIPLSSDEDAKIEMYHELCRILVEDAASCYIQDPYNTVAVNKRLTGYEVYPMYVQDMARVKLADTEN